MPTLVMKIDIFISSPGDMAEERQALMRVIEKLNRDPSLKDKYVFYPLLYEEEVPPEIGDSAQKIVDRFMPVQKSYILVSMFWTRMGTPFTVPETGEAFDSGTQYEILKGYEALQQRGYPHILLYRKTKENPQADPAQKEKVDAFFQKFKDGLSDIKGLFMEYQEAADLEEMIDDHIKNVMDKNPPDKGIFQQIASPEYEEEARRLDAAVPRQAAVGQDTDVRVMVCLPESKGLKAKLPRFSLNKQETTKRDVRQGDLSITFLKDKATGKLVPAQLSVKLETDDCKVKGEIKTIQVTPGRDSSMVAFRLVPLRARKRSMVLVRLLAQALTGGEIEIGSLPIYTEIKTNKEMLSPEPTWGMASMQLATAQQMPQTASVSVTAPVTAAVKDFMFKVSDTTVPDFQFFSKGNVQVYLTPPSAEDWIDTLQTHPSADMRVRAIRTLVQSKNSRLEEILKSLLKHDSASKVRAAAALALAQVGSGAAFEQLQEVMKTDSSASVRSSAAKALVQIDRQHAMGSILEVVLREPPRQAFTFANQIANEIGPEAIKFLEPAIQDKSTRVRKRTVRILGNLGDAAANDSLQQALNDNNSMVRNIAADALKKIGSL